ncbi:MAG: uracil phosphoribosyltransferase [Saprospiraceae bacterium]|nr:uracil phosphoribosyltransferase [Saprospiraceae bacterium]
MQVHHLGQDNTLANQFVAELRNTNIQNDRMRFRKNLERLGNIAAYEISKVLEYTTQNIETPLGIAQTDLPTQQPVIATILRAGLPFHQGVLSFFDQADNAFISAYRRHHKDGTFEINMEYVSCPDLTDRTLILCDPMLATGASLEMAVRELAEMYEPKAIHIATIIAAADGIEHLKRTLPFADLWTFAIDAELTARSYIVPGLGDAGDLAFGPKIQE